MVKKKRHMSFFSILVQQINEHDTKISSGEYYLIDDEYFVGFDSPNDIQQFHSKLIKQQQDQSITIDEDIAIHADKDSNDMDMKSFAQQFLVDSPQHTTKITKKIKATSLDIFSTNQPINWSPKVKDTKRNTQSLSRFIDCPSLKN